MTLKETCQQFIEVLTSQHPDDPTAHEIAKLISGILSKKAAVVLPWQTPEFAQAWGNYRAYRKRERKGWYKSPITEQRALMKLQQDTGDNEALAIATLLDCEANGWTGIHVSKKPRHEGRLLDALRYAGELS